MAEALYHRIVAENLQQQLKHHGCQVFIRSSQRCSFLLDAESCGKATMRIDDTGEVKTDRTDWSLEPPQCFALSDPNSITQMLQWWANAFRYWSEVDRIRKTQNDEFRAQNVASVLRRADAYFKDRTWVERLTPDEKSVTESYWKFMIGTRVCAGAALVWCRESRDLVAEAYLHGPDRFDDELLMRLVRKLQLWHRLATKYVECDTDTSYEDAVFVAADRILVSRGWEQKWRDLGYMT
jgi:hypothetical protein